MDPAPPRSPPPPPPPQRHPGVHRGRHEGGEAPHLRPLPVHRGRPQATATGPAEHPGVRPASHLRTRSSRRRQDPGTLRDKGRGPPLPGVPYVGRHAGDSRCRGGDGANGRVPRLHTGPADFHARPARSEEGDSRQGQLHFPGEALVRLTPLHLPQVGNEPAPVRT